MCVVCEDRDCLCVRAGDNSVIRLGGSDRQGVRPASTDMCGTTSMSQACSGRARLDSTNDLISKISDSSMILYV